MTSMANKKDLNQEKITFIVSMIYLITADKGGTGKSMMTRVILDALLAAGCPFTLMECDIGIPDTTRLFGGNEGYNIDTPEGWRLLYDNLLAAPIDRPVIITMPGGFLNRARTHMPGFLKVLPLLPEHLRRPLRVVWVGDDKRDVIQSMRDFREATGGRLVTDFIKNLKFCPADQFRFFNESEERKVLESNGGKVLQLPALSYRIAQMLTNDRLKRSDILKTHDLLDKIEFEDWWAKTIAIFTKAGYTP